jgi:hypothetical protein
MYKVRRKKLRCSRCLYEFTPKFIACFNLSEDNWKQLVRLFVLDRTIDEISYVLKLSKNTTYKAIRLLQTTLLNQNPFLIQNPKSRSFLLNNQPLIKKYSAKQNIQGDLFLVRIRKGNYWFEPMQSYSKHKSYVLKNIFYEKNIEPDLFGMYMNNKIVKNPNAPLLLTPDFTEFNQKLLLFFSVKKGINDKNKFRYVNEFSWKFNNRKLAPHEKEQIILDSLRCGVKR